MQWVRERYLAQIEALGKEYFSAPINIALGIAESATLKQYLPPTTIKRP
jgi:hypothetical protein